MFTKSERDVIAKSLEQLKAIPTENFLTGIFTNGVDKCCAVGHLNRLNSKNPEDYSQSNCSDYNWMQSEEERLQTFNPIRGLSARFLTPKYPNPNDEYSRDLSGVNNTSFGSIYKQATPKERVIACLEDMLKTEEVEAVAV